MKNVLYVLFVGLLFLTGCNIQSPVSVGSEDAKDVMDSLTYAKDPRTKLCFALVASRHAAAPGSNGFTITYVPCTPEVEARITK